MSSTVVRQKRAIWFTVIILRRKVTVFPLNLTIYKSPPMLSIDITIKMFAYSDTCAAAKFYPSRPEQLDVHQGYLLGDADS